MTRIVVAILASVLIAGCSGTSRVLPSISNGGSAAQAPALDSAPDRGDVKTYVRIRIPHRSRRDAALHPSTISTATQSVSISVNGKKAQIFNATTASPNCTVSSKGRTCTFALSVPAGTDVFTVTTYSGINGTGTPLDRGVTGKIVIKKGKANAIAVTLGPLVTTTGNSGPGSLRYAIAGASAGDTILFSLPAGATIALSTPIGISGNVKIAGPGYTKLAISGGGAHQLFSVTGTATISGLTLKNGKATAIPGGVVNNGGVLTLASDFIGSSSSIVAAQRGPRTKRAPRFSLDAHRLHPHCTTTYRDGGAVFNNGSLTITGTTFGGNILHNDLTNCIESRGGAIFNDQYGTLTSTGNTYTGNSAIHGGAVYSISVAATTFTNDKFTGNYGCTAATGCVASGCTATSCTTFAQGQGGAIDDEGLGVTITNSTFSNNVVGGNSAASVGYGGALYLNSQLPTVTGSTFNGNVAGGGGSSCSTGAGGAIVASNAFELDNDIFTNNSAIGDNNGEGGAVAAVLGLTGTGDTFTGNKVVVTGAACTPDGTAIGGAVFVGSATVTLAKSTFTSNSVAANETAGGGGLGGTDVAILSGCTFTSNTASANGQFGATGTTAAGGAFFANTTAKVSNSTFTSNTVTIAGPDQTEAAGGAVVVTGGSLLSNNNAYKSNAAIEKGGTMPGAGGAVAVLGGSMVSSNDAFTSNSATSAAIAEGGAVLFGGGGLVTNATVSSNKVTAPQAVGGGLAFNSSGTSSLTHVTISGNSASGSGIGAGGGLYDGAGAQVVNSTISGNTATTLGGGIFAVGSTELLENSSVTSNVVSKATQASSGGAGIFNETGIDVDNSTIANNTVTVGGPGPAGGGGILSEAVLTLVQSTISGNKVLGTAPQSGGGGIISGDDFAAANSTISNNSSSIDGGGLYQVNTGTVDLGNVTFYSNTATGKGGNIDNLKQISLYNAVVGGGSAPSGKDVYNAPAATLTSGGYTVFGSAFAGGGTYTAGTGDKFANPNLLPLANNGGPTFTNADQPSSPGRAMIPFGGGKCGTLTVTTDQRGYTRGAGGKCDAGAYEYAGVATAARHHMPVRHAYRHRAPRFKLPKLKPLRLKQAS